MKEKKKQEVNDGRQKQSMFHHLAGLEAGISAETQKSSQMTDLVVKSYCLLFYKRVKHAKLYHIGNEAYASTMDLVDSQHSHPHTKT